MLGTVSACSQPLTLGAKPGIPATRLLGAVDSSAIHYQSYTNPVPDRPHRRAAAAVGPGRGGALYRHYSLWSAGTISAGASTLRANGRSRQWEFPCWRNTGCPVPIRPPTSLNQPIHNTISGSVIGSGLEVRAPYVRVSPEIRYTNSGDPHFLSSNGGGSRAISAKPKS
jgi:hypothetical protein